MKTVFKILLISLVLTNCSSSKISNQEAVAVITSKENLDEYVSKLITIKGKITYSKIPTIIGVDVSCRKAYKINKNLNGMIAVSTGVLRKKVVTDADNNSSNRGNGVFYWLQHPKNKYVLAEVKLIEE